jgi:long-subunit acyl-CoA synthetase (AMP-forming)
VVINNVKNVFFNGQRTPTCFCNYTELEEGPKNSFEETPVEEEDLASIIYTFGTSGRRKGVTICNEA